MLAPARIPAYLPKGHPTEVGSQHNCGSGENPCRQAVNSHLIFRKHLFKPLKMTAHSSAICFKNSSGSLDIHDIT